MNILLTNDDGIDAGGINLLFEALSPYYQVYMIAPDRERSACSNAITVRRKLKLIKHDSRRYTADGFPADCVNIAIHSGKIPVPDLVVSGINHGPNMGDDVFFSGTVAGARTAFIFGRSGIAASIDHWGDTSPHMREAAAFMLDFVKEKENVLFHQPMLFNINYPDLPKSEVKGVKYTGLGRRIYFDKFITEEVSETETLLGLDGMIESVDREGTDVTELKRGYIAVTPLMLDCTDYPYLKAVTG